MKIKSILISIGSIALIASLASCSTVLRYSGGQGGQAGSSGPKVVDANDARANGVAGYGEFASNDRGDATRLSAPHNQIFHFDFDASNIKAEDKAAIEAQARYVASHPDAYILLTGNTDERGSREYNIALGERRANQVRAYLKQFGVKPNQVRTVSYGQERPIALGHNEESFRENRRVELIYEAQG